MAKRATALLLASAALVVAACGGGGQGSTTSLSLGNTQLTEVHAKSKKAPAAPVVKAAHKTARHGQTAKPVRHVKLTPAQKSKVAKRLAKVVVGALGYRATSIAMSGESLTVAIATQKACAGGPAGAATLLERLSKGVPFQNHVSLLASGGQTPLVDYAKAHCTTLAPPTAGGRIVLDKTGAGAKLIQTKPFTITSKTWSVAFANDGPFLQAFVVKDGKVQPMIVVATKRGSGKKVFKGPGRFALRIVGSQGWSIKVRDGA